MSQYILQTKKHSEKHSFSCISTLYLYINHKKLEEVECLNSVSKIVLNYHKMGNR